MSARQSILFVDDDNEFRRAMKKMFERWGYNVTDAAGGREALDLLSRNTYDLIISDLRMPDLDGVELMGEIKRKEIKVPIVFITGYGEIESYMDLMNMGAFDYINKPVKGKEILRVARKALDAHANSLRSLRPERP
ncbi:MAG: response regulator [Candidatus Hydrogenedentota bacterium]|nr:MAG: response regulator [Candidatus Hydrogenedentota bacterium]